MRKGSKGCDVPVEAVTSLPDFVTSISVAKDHMELKYAFQKNEIHGRPATWLGFLSEYNLKVSYLQGKANAVEVFYQGRYKMMYR